MARILYGIHGTGHGHAMRGLTIARALPQHEFLFIANDDAPSVLEPEFAVRRLPNLGTVFKNYKVDLSATIGHALPILLKRKKYIKKALDIIDAFKPDICMTDLEYFVPNAAKIAGIPTLTLDHQHILTCCEHRLPPGLRFDSFLQGLTPRYLFKPTEANLIISFYAPPVLPQYNAQVLPPILREKVIKLNPRNDGHIVVYQSNSMDSRLMEFLKNSTSRKAYVFGYTGEKIIADNIIYCSKSEEGFLELLAGCSFVIQGGSHTLMSEAIYLKKPVISLPIQAMIEQRLNAFYLEKLGYGIQSSMASLNKRLIENFEKDLKIFRDNAAKSQMLGNNTVFNAINSFAKTGKLN